MFQFPGLAPFRVTLTVGLPHSEILGSKLIRSSPRLIAAYYVLHRLHAPRHPLDALKALDRSHYQCPHPQPPLLQGDQGKRTRTKFISTPSGVVFDRSDQINQNSRGWLSLPGVRVKQAANHLFTMSKDPDMAFINESSTSKLCSLKQAT
jgi:hypothetical protein